MQMWHWLFMVNLMEKIKTVENRNLTTDKITLKERKQMFFGFEVPDLGDLKKIRIGHDDSGFGSGESLLCVWIHHKLNFGWHWIYSEFQDGFLDKVIITKMSTSEEIFFNCGKWLATVSSFLLIFCVITDALLKNEDDKTDCERTFSRKRWSSSSPNERLQIDNHHRR